MAFEMLVCWQVPLAHICKIWIRSNINKAYSRHRLTTPWVAGN